MKSFPLVNKADGQEEPLLISTTIFDGYIEKDNPFPMVDILPTLKTQKWLPATYPVEENGADLLYNLSYAFHEAGGVNMRIAARGNIPKLLYTIIIKK